MSRIRVYSIKLSHVSPKYPHFGRAAENKWEQIRKSQNSAGRDRVARKCGCNVVSELIKCTQFVFFRFVCVCVCVLFCCCFFIKGHRRLVLLSADDAFVVASSVLFLCVVLSVG